MVDLTTVMYVDDEPDIRAVVEMSLEMVAGLKVAVCASGQEALDRVAGVAPQLVLLDVMMPGLDGPGTLARLRERPELSHIPVVFLTAKVQPSEVARLRDLGAADVIAKPFDPMTLGDQVKAVWKRIQG